METKRKFSHKIVNTYNNGSITVFILFFCALAFVLFNDDLPIYPISYITLGWMLSLLFPILSIVYNISRQRVRRNQIIRAYRKDRLWDVYFPEEGSNAQFAFEMYLWDRLSVYYNKYESVIFSILAGAITFILYFFLAKQFGFTDKTIVLAAEGNKWAVQIGSAFLGSYSGAVILALRRYRTFDLRPTVFLQISAALIAGTLAGSFLTLLFVHPALGVLAFIIGYLAAINLTFLSRIMRKFFAKQTGYTFPEEIKSDLEKVIQNPEVIESLNRISIFSINELTSVDPIPLYFNMPQQCHVINSLIDQAILHFYFSEIITDLKRVHILRFTQLITRIRVFFEMGSQAKWPDKVSIIDNGGDKDIQLLKAAKAIVTSGHHHIILGLCHYYFRKRYFRGNQHSDE